MSRMVAGLVSHGMNKDRISTISPMTISSSKTDRYKLPRISVEIRMAIPTLGATLMIPTPNGSIVTDRYVTVSILT